MSRLSDIPGLAPDAVQSLTACGIESAEMLAGIPAEEIHRVMELTAWQQGKRARAPSLESVRRWTRLARGEAPDAGEIFDGGPDDIPEAIVVPRSAPPQAGKVFVPPSQRARLAASGPAAPAAAPMPFPRPAEAEAIPAAIPYGGAPPSAVPYAGTPPAVAPVRAVPQPPPPVSPPAPSPTTRFSTFEAYQTGNVRATPLSRYSIDAPGDPLAAAPIERIKAGEELGRTVRRGVLHPAPGLLISGAMISLLWRVAALASLVAVPWLLLEVERPSQHAVPISIAIGILTLLGIAQLIVIAKARCRICSCHLFYSRNCVKNRKAHSLPLFGKTASLSLHLLLFQWFRCMYCGTAIKLFAGKGER